MRDHIEGSQVAFIGRRVCFDRAHHHALVESLEEIANGRVVTERFDPDTEPGPDDLVTGDELEADLVRARVSRPTLDWQSELRGIRCAFHARVALLLPQQRLLQCSGWRIHPDSRHYIGDRGSLLLRD